MFLQIPLTEQYHKSFLSRF